MKIIFFIFYLNRRCCEHFKKKLPESSRIRGETLKIMDYDNIYAIDVRGKGKKYFLSKHVVGDIFFIFVMSEL